jgi:hypothetical protein
MSVPIPQTLGAPPQPRPQPDFFQISAAASVDFLKFFIRRRPDTCGRPGDIGTRGAWTQEEDNLLSEAVGRIGTNGWKEVAQAVPTRSAKQCRERWFNRLSPQVKSGPFEAWEDQILMTRQREVGNRWSQIAQSLPGRTASAVKNRWYSSLRTMDFTESTLAKTDCQQQQL